MKLIKIEIRPLDSGYVLEAHYDDAGKVTTKEMSADTVTVLMRRLATACGYDPNMISSREIFGQSGRRSRKGNDDGSPP